MKKVGSFILVMIMLLTCVPYHANASSGYLGYGIVLCRWLSIRATQVDNSNQRLARAARGETLELLEKSGDWYKVRYGTTVGYALAKYIAVNPDTVYAPKLTQVYCYPSYSAKCIAELDKETLLKVIDEYWSDNTMWYCVYISGSDRNECGFVPKSDCYFK